LEYSLAYEVISSEPALSVSSVVHQIKLRRVTNDNTTLVEWSSDYANDVTQAVLQDSKYKKLEVWQFKSLLLGINSES
jgi:hypothetical protein